jgi:hypothetical protein
MVRPLDTNMLTVGCVVSYRLPANQLPVDKNKLGKNALSASYK